MMALLSSKKNRNRLGVLQAAFLLFSFSHGVIAAQENTAGVREIAAAGASRTVQVIAFWAVSSGDSRNLPFVIVDKLGAKAFVFNARGKLMGSSAVLLGLARGDDTVPGIGERPIASIEPAERTTPAGRFVAQPGRNLDGEHIIWIDYDAALSIHRVRPGPARERRLERLASPTPADNRISYGCVTTPVRFYEKVIAPAFAGGKGIVYILPETGPTTEVFGFIED